MVPTRPVSRCVSAPGAIHRPRVAWSSTLIRCCANRTITIPNPEWFKRDGTPTPHRQPKPGEEVWRLRDPSDGRVQRCELRDDTRAGAGWDVSILEGDELLLSRRYGTEEHARYCAEVMKQDTRCITVGSRTP